MKECPVCRRQLGSQPQGPFCSARCRSVDLGKWLNAEYVVSRPLDETDFDDELAMPEPTDRQ